MDREREDRKHIIIKNIQKTVPGLSLSARKNPSISPDGFNTLGFADGGARADTGFIYKVSNQSSTLGFNFLKKAIAIMSLIFLYSMSHGADGDSWSTYAPQIGISLISVIVGAVLGYVGGRLQFNAQEDSMDRKQHYTVIIKYLNTWENTESFLNNTLYEDLKIHFPSLRKNIDSFIKLKAAVQPDIDALMEQVLIKFPNLKLKYDNGQDATGRYIAANFLFRIKDERDIMIGDDGKSIIFSVGHRLAHGSYWVLLSAENNKPIEESDLNKVIDYLINIEHNYPASVKIKKTLISIEQYRKKIEAEVKDLPNHQKLPGNCKYINPRFNKKRQKSRDS